MNDENLYLQKLQILMKDLENKFPDIFNNQKAISIFIYYLRKNPETFDEIYNINQSMYGTTENDLKIIVEETFLKAKKISS